MIETTAPSVLRLLIVDDHEVVRGGLVALLERRSAFSVVAQVGTVAEAIEAARRHRPDLVIMDVRLSDGSGIEATREIRAENPAIKVVMLTSYPDDEAVFAAIIAGASGYLLKQIRGRDLIAALEAVGRGESLLDPAVTEKVLDRVRRIATGTNTEGLAQLTAQEQTILLRRGRGQDEQGDRRRGLPLGQDGEELRQLDPRQAEPPASRAGCRLHGPPPQSGRPVAAGAGGARSRPGCPGLLRLRGSERRPLLLGCGRGAASCAYWAFLSFSPPVSFCAFLSFSAFLSFCAFLSFFLAMNFSLIRLSVGHARAG